MEAVCQAGEESDFGVGRFGQTVGEAMFECGVDGLPVTADRSSHLDKE